MRWLDHLWVWPAVAALAALAWAGVELARAAREVRKDVGGLTGQLSTSLEQINHTELQISKNVDLEQQQVTEALTALKHIFQDTHENLVGRDMRSGLFGQARTLLASSNTLVLDTDAAAKQAAVTLERASEDLHQSARDLHTLASTLDADLADPHLKDSFAELDRLLAAVAEDAAQVKLLLVSSTATSEDVRRVADKFAEEYTKAQNLYYAIFKEVLTVGSQGVQFFLKK